MADPVTTFQLKFLGPLEVSNNGQLLALPQSKKTRALLAYLAITGRSHRRERLCQLLWDVADDPRGALRWSLSKLRRVVDGDDKRLLADRDTVVFDASDVDIDLQQLKAAVVQGVDNVATDELERLAKLSRGELLQGLELTDFHEFHAWCIAEREEARRKCVQVLAELVSRLQSEPERALPHARSWVHADELSIPGRVALLRMLMATGRAAEAQQQFQIGERVLHELGSSGAGELSEAWKSLNQAVGPTAVVVSSAPTTTPTVVAQDGIVGRAAETALLLNALDEVRRSKNQRIVVVQGEPGSGKSRLSEFLMEQLAQDGGVVFEAKCFEAESSRPYGPWVDALAGRVDEDFFEAEKQSSRDVLFAAVTEAIGSHASRTGGAAVIFDDLQWMDRDSASLLHFVTRMNRQRPILVVLLGRTGELTDNDAALQALRSIRRELRVEEIQLEPMSEAEIGELIEPSGANAASIYAACAGNPLYALELAQSSSWAQSETPRSLVELVRERVDGLPPDASEALRWAAVLGYTFDVSRLEALSSLSLDALVGALESLEQHRLIREDRESPGSRYRFSHDIVRESIYGELSAPRRRLMHQRIATLLEPSMGDSRIANQIAHHCTLAGNADLGIRACLAAGRRSLRVFANGDAEDLANKGLHLAESLSGPERVTVELDLLQIRYGARVTDVEAAANRIQELTDQALDLGLVQASRLGFHLLGLLRWDHGSVADAHKHMMDAERISRSAEPVVRAEALAEAARCLVLLERNLEQAEAFALEAASLGERHDHRVKVVPFVVGMLQQHRGNVVEAIDSYREARGLARERGDRLAEFGALEHEVMLEIDRNNVAEARALCVELENLGTKVREGSEALAGTGLRQLADASVGEAPWEPLHETLEQLRILDAKYRRSYLLTRAARRLEELGDLDAAKHLAAEGLEAAVAIDRASEIALARVVLAKVAARRSDDEALDAQRRAIRQLDPRYVGSSIRQQLKESLND